MEVHEVFENQKKMLIRIEKGDLVADECIPGTHISTPYIKIGDSVYQFAWLKPEDNHYTAVFCGTVSDHPSLNWKKLV
jgi:hypothetical protein